MNSGPIRTHRQIAEAIAASGGFTVSALGLRFDRVVTRLLDRLGHFVEAEHPHVDAVMLLTLTAPIREPANTAAALEQEITALFRSNRPGAERGMRINGMGAALRLVDTTPRQHSLLGFVRNPEVDSALLLDLAERWLRSAA